MKQSAFLHANVAFLCTILLASAVTMLWLFWRFPLATAIATAAVLTAMLISARLAKSSDSDSLAGFKPRRSGLGSH